MIRKLSFLALALLTFGFSYSQTVQKVIIEDYTGAWCGYCPDGTIVLENILTTKPNTIGVGIHNQDAMVTANGNTITSFFNTSGSYPAGCVNQLGAAISRNNWASATNSALNAIPVAGVSLSNVTYDPIFRTLTATVNATFTMNGTGIFRLNFFITEDSVSGIGSGYNQSNYYSSSSSAAGGPSHPLYNSANPIQGYPHRDVLRYAHGSFGVAGSVNNILSGETNSYTFTTTLAAGWDIEQIHLIGILNKFDGSAINQRYFVNAEEVKLTEALLTANEPEKLLTGVTVAPNPFSEKVMLTFNLEGMTELKAEVIDVNGKLIQTLASGTMNAGIHTVKWDGTNAASENVANGIYFIRIGTASGKSYSSRVSLQR